MLFINLQNKNEIPAVYHFDKSILKRWKTTKEKWEKRQMTIDRINKNYEDQSIRGIDPRIFEIEESLDSMSDQDIQEIFVKSPVHIDIVSKAFELNQKHGAHKEVLLEELAKRKSNDPENENLLQVLINFTSMKPETIKRLHDVLSNIELP